MSSQQRNSIRLLSCTIAGLTVTLSSAFAEDVKPANQSLGIMSFANVQVIKAETPDAAPIQLNHTDGLRAYIDPKTRKLRAQTAEERNKAGEEHAARQSAKNQALAARGGDADAQENSEARTFYAPSGAVGVRLTEEHMIFQIARKTDDGLVRDEVTGKSAAKKALRPSKKSLTDVEVSNER